VALITAAEARLHIPELTGTGEDTNLDTVIGRVGAIFAAWCGYPPSSTGGAPSMESASYTRYYDGPGGRDLILDVWPVTAITSIYDDPTRDWTSSSYLVSSSDYAIVDGERGQVLLKSTASWGAWGKAEKSIKVAFTAGFTTVPADIKQAAALAVRHVWGLRRNQGKENVSEGGISISLRDEDALPDVVQQILSMRRLPRAIL
jgi:hypothetical protein